LYNLYNFRAPSVVEFNPVTHVRGQQRLAERGNPTDAVSFEIEFVDADDSEPSSCADTASAWKWRQSRQISGTY
jgi:hypothetical protein